MCAGPRFKVRERDVFFVYFFDPKFEGRSTAADRLVLYSILTLKFPQSQLPVGSK